MPNRTSIPVEKAMKLVTSIAAVMAVASLLAVSYTSGLNPIDFTPSVGIAVEEIAAGATTIGLCVGLIALFGIPRQKILCLLLALGLLVSLDMLSYFASGTLSLLTPAQTTVRTVTISSVEQVSDEPDCLWAYYYRNSPGKDAFICTVSETPATVGSKLRLVERRNQFGTAIMDYSVVPAAEASAQPPKAVTPGQ